MFNKETYFKFCEDFHPFSLETNHTTNMIEVKHHKPYFYWNAMSYYFDYC